MCARMCVRDGTRGVWQSRAHNSSLVHTHLPLYDLVLNRPFHNIERSAALRYGLASLPIKIVFLNVPCTLNLEKVN